MILRVPARQAFLSLLWFSAFRFSDVWSGCKEKAQKEETKAPQKMKFLRPWALKTHYPLTRNYSENNSWELFFVIFEAYCALEMSRKERHFQGITREIRNFSKNNYFRIIFRKYTFWVRAGQFQVQVCLVTERAISWQMHLSLVLKAFGPLISHMSWEWTNRNAANRHLELPGRG